MIFRLTGPGPGSAQTVDLFRPSDHVDEHLESEIDVIGIAEFDRLLFVFGDCRLGKRISSAISARISVVTATLSLESE